MTDDTSKINRNIQQQMMNAIEGISTLIHLLLNFTLKVPESKLVSAEMDRPGYWHHILVC